MDISDHYNPDDNLTAIRIMGDIPRVMNGSVTLTTVGPPVDPDDYDYVFYFDGDISTFQEPWTSDKAFWPTVVTYGLTFTLGIIGNILVVFALLLDRKSRNVTSYFLVSLAVADIAFLIICVPYETLIKLKKLWAGGLVLCKIAGFVEMLTAVASVMNLMAVSIERYVVIVHPMKSRSWCTVGNTKKIIISVWLVALLLSSPILHIMNTDVGVFYNNSTHAVIRTCAESNVRGPNDLIIFVYYQLIITFVVPVIIMLYCYIVVIRVLWISTKELARMTQLQSTTASTNSSLQSHKSQSRPSKSLTSRPCTDRSAETREARKQVIKMLLTIITFFFLCWGPKLILNVLKRHEVKGLHLDASFYAGLVINILPYVHSCVNPIIYSFMSNNFRRSMRTGCQTCSNYHDRSCSRNNRRSEFDMDTKGTNGHSRYSPPYTAKRSGRTYSTVMTDC